MLLVHRPEDSPEVQYDIDTLSAVEGGAIERVLGLPWSEVEEQIRAEAPTAMLAILWAFRKRSEPTLKFAGFDVPNFRKRLVVMLTTDEITSIVEEVNRELPEGHEDREATLRRLRRAAADPADVDKAAAGEGPKGTAAASLNSA